jgi:hypothetical protein
LLTCKYNEDIAFIIPTDMAPPPAAPDNVRFVLMTLETISDRASSILGFPVAIGLPYKLCDFKPLYGEIFKPELIECDFWGHADLDVLWGNIREFITPEVTERYDIICGSVCGVCGHFTLYRATVPFSDYLQKMPGLQRFLSASSYQEIDEIWWNAWLHNGMAGIVSISLCKAVYAILTGRMGAMFFGRFAWHSMLFDKLFFRPRRFESGAIVAGISKKPVKIYKKQLCKPPCDMIWEYNSLRFTWNKGMLFENNANNTMEWMYLHFHDLKKGNIRINLRRNAQRASHFFSLRVVNPTRVLNTLSDASKRRPINRIQTIFNHGDWNNAYILINS